MDDIYIGNKAIGIGKKPFIIAEISGNHGGSLKRALELIEKASLTGADAVKFQTFKAESLVSKDTPKVEYQKTTTSPEESHYQMIKKLELSHDQHILLIRLNSEKLGCINFLVHYS